MIMEAISAAGVVAADGGLSSRRRSLSGPFLLADFISFSTFLLIAQGFQDWNRSNG